MDEPRRTSGQAATDEQIVTRVVESLARRVPGLAADVIAERVRQSHARFRDAPVREFVPVLVEREVHGELAHRGQGPDVIGD